VTLRHFVAFLEYRAREQSLNEAERERARRGDPPDPALYTVLRAQNRRTMLSDLNVDDRALNHAHSGAVPATLVVLVGKRAFKCSNGGMSRMAVAHVAFCPSKLIAEIGFN
jgi:hypothetical protein